MDFLLRLTLSRCSEQLLGRLQGNEHKPERKMKAVALSAMAQPTLKVGGIGTKPFSRQSGRKSSDATSKCGFDHGRIEVLIQLFGTKSGQLLPHRLQILEAIR